MGYLADMGYLLEMLIFTDSPQINAGRCTGSVGHRHLLPNLESGCAHTRQLQRIPKITLNKQLTEFN
jgi:hypothetical protein